jgi:hypothetical protein
VTVPIEDDLGSRVAEALLDCTLMQSFDEE